ncbi:MAG: oligopeptide transporter, OPT family [Candidatus Thermoplasmatota archaeon]|jgi:putative OPT family oligopeptide transporter|nr:oligopeptide transporter, OPT family [Candidatus Thermoplasmatota archaeon]
MANDDFIPYIKHDTVLPELTFRALIVGVLLTILMAAANAYLGLYAGMTVSATIPAVVMGLAVLKPMKANILEINLSKCVAVAGESLAAGVIFTIPGLVVLHRMTGGLAGWSNLWGKNGYYIILTIIIALMGGLLGVLFTIPLRNVLIKDLALPFPEGVASAEVLKSCEKGGSGMKIVFGALGMGALFKYIGSPFGFSLWKEKMEGVLGGGRVRMYGGLNLSPALLGVGYILGLKISSLVFLGGVIGWILMLPLVGAVSGWPVDGLYYELNGGGSLGSVWQVWFENTLYVGVGAIVTGGIWTLIKMRKAIAKGVGEAIRSTTSKGDDEDIIRTEKDFRMKLWYFAIISIIVGIVYFIATKNILATVVATIMMFVATFVFTAIAGYLAGVVGSSNNPISGVTVATLLFTALLLMILPVDKYVGMTATIIVGAVVCVSAAIAGDSMQELKTGQLLGATPYNLQIARFLGVAVAALVVPFVVFMLDDVYSIGSANLLAPQATVMATIAKGVFQWDLNYLMFFIGVVIAIILIALDLSVMAVAIGIYLPFTLTLPIMLGGIIKHLTGITIAKRVDRVQGLSKEKKKSIVDRILEKTETHGILVSSGLIAGEAIAGVFIALLYMCHVQPAIFSDPVSWPGFLVFAYLGFLIWYFVVRGPLRSKDIVEYSNEDTD